MHVLWQFIDISLRILYTWTSQYKTVHSSSYYIMTFHDVVYCDMYSLVPCHGRVYLPNPIWSMYQYVRVQTGIINVIESIYEYILVHTGIYSFYWIYSVDTCMYWYVLVCTSTYWYVLVRTPTFSSVRDEKRCKQDTNPQSSAHLWQSLPLSYGTGPRHRDIIQAIIKVYIQCFCNTPCLFTWCLMTNRRRRSSCATAAGHDVPRPSPDLDLPVAQMRSIARLRACNVQQDRSSVPKKAVTWQLPCFSTLEWLDTDEASQLPAQHGPSISRTHS